MHFICQKTTLWTSESPAATQDLGIAVDVNITTQHILAPLWVAGVSVQGKAK
jgi:hypothetical protein